MTAGIIPYPRGSGYSAEEQITGEGKHGGLQIMVYPMKREVFERRFPVRSDMLRARVGGGARGLLPVRGSRNAAAAEMGLAPGGKMRQQIYDDPYDFSDWDTEAGSRCFVHIANSLVWRAITGADAPTVPPTAKEYTAAGLPWFDYYSDGKAIEGSKTLDKLKSVLEMGKDKGDVPLPENDSVTPENVVHLRKGRAPDQVGEGRF